MLLKIVYCIILFCVLAFGCGLTLHTVSDNNAIPANCIKYSLSQIDIYFSAYTVQYHATLQVKLTEDWILVQRKYSTLDELVTNELLPIVKNISEYVHKFSDNKLFSDIQKQRLIYTTVNTELAQRFNNSVRLTELNRRNSYASDN